MVLLPKSLSFGFINSMMALLIRVQILMNIRSSSSSRNLTKKKAKNK